MNQSIAMTTLVVSDYDEAIAFYCELLGFELLEDTQLSPTKRWVRVAPTGGHGGQLLLARADGASQHAAIGNQTGGRVGFFLYTDDFDRDHTVYETRGVDFIRPPESHDYGKVAVFRDPFGNLWDLLQPTR